MGHHSNVKDVVVQRLEGSHDNTILVMRDLEFGAKGLWRTWA